jgi:tRNA dimethylallyltransferase
VVEDLVSAAGSDGKGEDLRPLIVLVGPTASGKTSLAIRLAEEFGGEIVSCDSVAVYREMEIGTAKPTMEERARVPHHMIDVAWPNESCTAGDYSRGAREALEGISGRGRVPIVAGGTGLYLRAMIDGLFDAPVALPGRRERLREIAEKRGAGYLHRILRRVDARAAEAIHENDVPKVIRAIEVSVSTEGPLTEQWKKKGRDSLEGYRILRLGLNPERGRLYEQINCRAAEMFDRGLVEETERLVERFGRECRPFGSLGYAQAMAVMDRSMSREEAVADAQQGHRNYAKRQLTWFRREKEMCWLAGCGGDDAVVGESCARVRAFLG